MPEIEIDPAEVLETTRFVQYDEWHSLSGPALWKRLEVPGQMMNGSYTNEWRFNAKEMADGKEYGREVSHHERLDFWDERLSVVFAVEHYLKISRLGSPSPKILEIGSWPQKNAIVETEHDNTVLALLSQNQHYNVVGVDNVDISRVYPYRSYSLPNFGSGLFINGDFYDPDVQSKVFKKHRNNPDVIVGNMVFDRRLGNFRHRYIGTQAEVASQLWVKDAADITEPSERISKAANDFLKPQGVLIICNYGRDVPDFVHNMPLLAVYLDPSGVKPHVQVRQKI